MFFQALCGMTVKGLELPSDVKLIRFVAGTTNREVEDGEEFIPVKVAQGIYVTACIAPREAGKHAIARGVWALEADTPEGDALIAPQALVEQSPEASLKQASEPTLVKAEAPKPPEPLRVKQANEVDFRKSGGPVTPGQNEVAILLTQNEARRVLEAVKGGMPIQTWEAPGIIRQIEEAFKR